jgi:aryl-alcohol dehydrogenase-like predicted oxidoreductase
MDTRKLGKNGPAVSALGPGLHGNDGIYGSRTAEIATIHRAIDLGVNLIVTSDAYGARNNEEVVGASAEPVPRHEFGNTGGFASRRPSAGHLAT